MLVLSPWFSPWCWRRGFVSRITCVRPCHNTDIYTCVAAAWQPRAALEAKSEHPRRSRRDGQPQELPAASIDPTADDCCCATNKLYSELALRCGRIGFRLPVRVPPAAAERAAVGACMTMRSWRGSGGRRLQCSPRATLVGAKTVDV